MDWLENHLGSLGYAADFYVPRNCGAGDNGAQEKRIAGEEQTRKKINYGKPRVVQTDKYDFPRIQKFFEWEQFLDYIDWRGREKERLSQNTSQVRYNRALTACFQDAMKLARYGWVDGLLAVKSMQKIDVPMKQIIQQTFNMECRYDVAGGSVNIGRYLVGMPDCMRHPSSVLGHNLSARIQKVLILCSYDSKTQVDAVMNHGFMIYQIINALEQANIQTEITLVFHANKDAMYANDDYYTYETYIKIKEPTDTIYPEKLLFCLAHPSMLRRLVFSEWERNPRDVRKLFHFYSDSDNDGYARYIPSWLPPEYMLKDTLVIPNIANAQDTDQMIARVQNMIKSQYEHTR